ncbi:MAG: hypothetical protein GXP28_07510 [Planctomycetes bacterium]|nr:hypothetical protein [Planctomycetota bacterium]
MQMTNKSQLSEDSTIWQLTANTADLRSPQLCGEVDLRNPFRGLHALNYCATPLEGSVLGLGMVGETASVEGAFVRGDDLVAAYRAGDDCPFSLQVYWTVSPRENGVVVIDVLLSLETPLLESFPKVFIKSELSGAEVWQPDEGRDYLVLRSLDKNWSYAEMAHPTDLGDWQIDEKGAVLRTLGGAFLEKGVIRRLRLRGAFLPRDKDLQLAAECLAELAAEAPPLTA